MLLIAAQHAKVYPAGGCSGPTVVAGFMLFQGDLAGRGLARTVKEVEAESVSYVVASAHGMDSGAYSFPYVVAWAGVDPAAVESTSRRVATAARAIFDASPAEHGPGGRGPKVEHVAWAARAQTTLHHDAPAASAAAEAVGL